MIDNSCDRCEWYRRMWDDCYGSLDYCHCGEYIDDECHMTKEGLGMKRRETLEELRARLGNTILYREDVAMTYDEAFEEMRVLLDELIGDAKRLPMREDASRISMLLTKIEYILDARETGGEP